MSEASAPEPAARELTDAERALVREARMKAHILYEGRLTPHRSCGVCLAETFGLPWRPYQSLRRGGITGEGACGAIVAGELILGELLGPDDPTAPPGERLKTAMRLYRDLWRRKREAEGWADTICNTLTAPFPDFAGPGRAGFCTTMAADAAEFVAETLVRVGAPVVVEPFPEAD